MYFWYNRGSSFFRPLKKKIFQAFQPVPDVEPVHSLPLESSQHFHYKNRLLNYYLQVNMEKGRSRMQVLKSELQNNTICSVLPVTKWKTWSSKNLIW